MDSFLAANLYVIIHHTTRHTDHDDGASADKRMPEALKMPIGYRNHGAVANCNEALKMDSSCQYPAKIYDAADSRKLFLESVHFDQRREGAAVGRS